MGALGILVPALFAGLVAIGVTVAIERWGGRAGGLIATLPSTIVPSAAGMAALGDADALRDAMLVTPVGMLLNAAFLYLWRILPPRLPGWGLGPRLVLMTAASVAAWALMAAGAVSGTGAARDGGVSLVGVGVGFTVGIAVFGALACLRNPPSPSGHRKVSPAVLLARGTLAATAIGIGVWLSGRGDGLAAGVAAVFPAIYLTTMVALWVSQGEAVQGGAVGPMMLGGTSVAVYALAAAVLLPALGIALGSVVSWALAACLVTVPAWWWLRWLGRARAPRSATEV